MPRFPCFFIYLGTAMFFLYQDFLYFFVFLAVALIVVISATKEVTAIVITIIAVIVSSTFATIMPEGTAAVTKVEISSYALFHVLFG